MSGAKPSVLLDRNPVDGYIKELFLKFGPKAPHWHAPRASTWARLTPSGLLPWAAILVAMIALLGFFYLRANLPAPMQRDGAHFVFMANNIAHGQPPYWASFETKNPLIELYWSPFLHILGERFGLIEAARVAEALWVAATSLLVFCVIACTGVKRAASTMPIAVVAALLYFVLASDVRVTDDGLNIALYQSLPELALVAHLIRRPDKRWFAHGLLAGVFVFLGWFVKQTSLFTDALVIVVWLAIVRDRRAAVWSAGMCTGALAGVGIFWLHLQVTGTTYNYLLGAVIYRSGLSPVLLSGFLGAAKQSFQVPLWELPLDSLLAVHRVWTTIAMVLLIPLAAIDLWRSHTEKWQVKRVALLLSVTWMVAAWLQAVLSLTFFPHYFLASLAPVCVVTGILIANSRPIMRLITFAATGLLVAFLVHSYQGMRKVNIAAAQLAPINRSTKDVLRFLKPGDKVFNWSGLPNVLVAYGAPSAYPLNMSWPYIMTALPEAARTSLLKHTLADAPDVVIVMDEHYPVNQGIIGTPMTAERLKALTGEDYSLVYTTAPIVGRYGDPVSVFRRSYEIELDPTKE